jgi:predicted MFS family arabinose efflux permease
VYTRSYKRYVTVLLLAVYSCSYVDRQILALLIEPVRRELRLSDTQMGFLSGPAFVLFYSTLGIPIARLADRSNRVNIISISIAIWSGMTMLCGIAGTFWHLLLARIGVGIGEAGCTPPAQSLIADYVPASERTRALSIYMLGMPIGILVGYLLGGWISQTYGWRAAFLIVGFPGVILGFLVKKTMEEPRGRAIGMPVDRGGRSPSIRVVFSKLWRCQTLRHLMIGMTLVGIVLAGTLAWLPTLFVRVHRMVLGELGTWLALVSGVGGGVGIWLGGYLTARYGTEDERVQVRLLAVSATLVAPILVTALLWPTKEVALLLLLPANICMFFFYGPYFSLVQGLCDVNIRATMVAVVMLIQLMFGGSIGGQLVGLISDALTPLLDRGALRWAMVMTSLLALWGAVHFWLAARSIRQDLFHASSGVMFTRTI